MEKISANLQLNVSFLQAVATKCLLSVARTSPPYFPHLFVDWSKFVVRDLHTMLLSIFEFRKKRRRESDTFLMNANETRKLHIEELLSS